ncbi:MAG TPA: 50S ribosomal protein L15 [Candidatus Paceibacterota bacterium]|nr:50S ribosomal protein L15 [Candidatus Paceibacterota bacterium]
MQSNQLKRIHKNKKSARVGRGGKRGKTAGRGTKGQKARAGRKLRPEMRDIIKKLPKRRGRGKNSFLSIQEKPLIINLTTLEAVFENGEKITPSSLVKKNVVSLYKGRTPRVKILGDGDFSKKVEISGCLVSAGAKSKIEKAGGKIS